MEDIRLEKLVADAAGVSRRSAKAMIKGGRVSVDGSVCTAPDIKVDPERSEVLIDGVKAAHKSSLYIMLNKPAGYLSATEDASKETVLDLLPEKYTRHGLFPAGRLDRDSEGLLLLTNDGDFCHNVISPKKNVEKEYYIETDEPMTEADREVFSSGAPMGGGETARPAKLLLPGGNSAYVTVREGKFHQVKRMVNGVGKNVTYLKRVRIGGLRLDETLPIGGFRELSDSEKDLVFLKVTKH